MVVGSWADFEDEAARLAAFGRSRIEAGVAWLATVRPDGAPRVHPVSPRVSHGTLIVFMYPTSPKGRDLRRDPRFSLHATVEDSLGGAGEFSVSGTAAVVGEEAERARLMGGADAAAPYVVFALDVREVLAVTYRDGKPLIERWSGP